MKEKLLIVNADDFGMSRGITDGILLAHREGFLTSASLMTNMPAADYAVACLAQAPALGVGVHLNICTGRPLLPPEKIPTLVDSKGNFHRADVVIRKLWRWQVSGQEIESEFRAQLRWAKDRGIAPKHADSHHHLNLYPAAAIPFARALQAEGIARTRSPRCSVWPKQRSIGGPHEGNLARRMLVQTYRASLRHTVFRKLAMPDSRISFLSSDRRNFSGLKQGWKSTLEHLPAGLFELACHPGIFERGFSETDRILEQREEELRWLTSRDLIDAVKSSGIRLVTYQALTPTPAVPHAAAQAPAL